MGTLQLDNLNQLELLPGSSLLYALICCTAPFGRCLTYEDREKWYLIVSIALTYLSAGWELGWAAEVAALLPLLLTQIRAWKKTQKNRKKKTPQCSVNVKDSHLSVMTDSSLYVWQYFQAQFFL